MNLWYCPVHAQEMTINRTEKDILNSRNSRNQINQKSVYKQKYFIHFRKKIYQSFRRFFLVTRKTLRSLIWCKISDIKNKTEYNAIEFSTKLEEKIIGANKLYRVQNYYENHDECKESRSISKPTETQAESYVIVM